jgi:hypothetical protein
LLTPTSDGASKFGDERKRIKAVFVSDLTIEKSPESEPELIVIVTDSERTIVAALRDVAPFSANEKDALFVKVGAVVSGVYRTITIPDPPTPPVALPPEE